MVNQQDILIGEKLVNIKLTNTVTAPQLQAMVFQITLDMFESYYEEYKTLPGVGEILGNKSFYIVIDKRYFVAIRNEKVKTGIQCEYFDTNR